MTGEDHSTVIRAMALVTVLLLASTITAGCTSRDDQGAGISYADDSGDDDDPTTGGSQSGTSDDGTGVGDKPGGGAGPGGGGGDPDPSDKPDEPVDPEEPPEEQAPEFTKQPVRSWTTFFYVAYDNSIGPMEAWESDLRALEEVGSSDDVNLVALVDQEYVDDCEIVFIQEGGSWSYPVQLINPDWSDEVDTGDPDVLFEFLRWGVEWFPAERYDVHAMDHGGGWMGFCIDETAPDSSFIDAWEAREVFSDVSALIGRNIDLLSCDMCFMACVEFGYELSDSVDILNGLQTYATGDDDGQGGMISNWDYRDIWAGLKENPEWTGEELALHQLDNMIVIGPYAFPSLGMVHVQSTDAFGAADLRVADECIQALDTLALELYENVTGSGEELAEEQLLVDVMGHPESPPDRNTETFTGCSPLMAGTPYKLFDMGDLLHRLAEHGNRLCSPDTVAAVRAAYDDMVLGCRHGDDHLSGEHPDATGLNIYLPYQSRGYLEAYGETRMAQDTHWDEFLAEVPWNS